MSYYRIWRYWLLAVSVFIIAFGTIMALLNTTVVFAFFNDQINPVFWGLNPVPSSAQAFQAWVYGTWGATVMDCLWTASKSFSKPPTRMMFEHLLPP